MTRFEFDFRRVLENNYLDRAEQDLKTALATLAVKPSHQVTPEEGIKDLVEEKPFLEIVMEEIAYQTREQENPELEQGQRRILVTGQKGQKRVFVEVLNGQPTILGQEVLSLAVDELVEVGSKVVAESAKQPLTIAQPQALKQGEEGKVISSPRLQPAPDSALPKTATQEDNFLPLAGLAFLGMGLLAGRKKQED